MPFAAPLAYLVVRNAEEGGVWSTLDRRRAPRPRSAAACCWRRPWRPPRRPSARLAAWLVMRTDLPGRRVIRLLLPLPLVLPSFIGAFALIAAFAPGGLLERVLGAAGGDRPPRGPGLRRRLRGADPADLPLRLPAGGRAPASAAAGDGGVGPPARSRAGRDLRDGGAAAGASGDRRGGAPGLPLRHRRLRGRAAAALRHADPGDLSPTTCSTRRSPWPSAWRSALLAIVVVVAQRRVAGGRTTDARRSGRRAHRRRWAAGGPRRSRSSSACSGSRWRRPVAVLVYWTVGASTRAPRARTRSSRTPPAWSSRPSTRRSPASAPPWSRWRWCCPRRS